MAQPHSGQMELSSWKVGLDSNKALSFQSSWESGQSFTAEGWDAGGLGRGKEGEKKKEREVQM